MKSNKKEINKKIFLTYCVLSLMMSTVCVLLLGSCIKPKTKIRDKIYMEETEDLSDILNFVKEVDFEKLDPLIPTEKEITEKPELEDKLWKDLVDCTIFIRMPRGYEDNFALRKYLVVEYIYESRINGMRGLSFDDECKMVKEFLIKKVYKISG